MITAIVLAGGLKPNLTGANNLTDKEALITIGNRYMVDYVVDALRNSLYIGTIIITGPVSELKKIYGECPNIKFVESGTTSVNSFINALNQSSVKIGQILAVTADIPLLTKEAVDHFIETCQGIQGGDLYYPIVSREINEVKYPGVKRTYVYLKDGVFTGGNIFLMNAEIVKKCAKEAEELFRLRKKPIALASYVGWRLLINYIFRRLTIKEAEHEVSRLLGGIKGVGIISPYPEIGIDVDKPSDLALVEKALASSS